MKDYTKALIIFIMNELIFFSFLIFFYVADPQYYPEYFILSSLIYSLLFIIGTIIGAVLFGYLLTPLYLFVHKKIIGRNKTYGIQETPKPQKFELFKGFFPVLLALNLSLMLLSSETIVGFVYGEKIDLSTMDIETFNVLMGLFSFFHLFTIVISFALFSPTWFLLDAGVVYSSKESENKKGRPGEGRAVGGWYINILKGYAGIGTIISYFLLYMLFINISLPLLAIIIVLIYYSTVPIFMVGATIIALIIFDALRENRVKYARKWAKKLGITDKVEIVFKKIE